MQKLRKDGTIQDEINGTIRVGGIGGFLAMEVWMVSCVGRPEEWSVLDKIALKTPDPS